MITLAPLTVRQREILDWIEAFIAENGYAPTLCEIGKGVGIASTNGVSDHLLLIEKKGWIRRVPMSARALVVVQVESTKGP